MQRSSSSASRLGTCSSCCYCSCCYIWFFALAGFCLPAPLQCAGVVELSIGCLCPLEYSTALKKTILCPCPSAFCEKAVSVTAVQRLGPDQRFCSSGLSALGQRHPPSLALKPRLLGFLCSLACSLVQRLPCRCLGSPCLF